MLFFFKRLAAYLRRQMGWLLLILLAIGLQTGFRLVMPLAFRAIFDVAVVHSDYVYLFEVIAAVTAYWLVQALASLGQDAAAARAGLHVINQLRERMYDLVVNLSPAKLQKLRGGDLPARFSSDLLIIEQAVVQHIHVVLFSALNLILSIGLLFYLDWRLAVLTFTGMIVGLLLPKLFTERAYAANYSRKSQEGKLLDDIQEQVHAGEVIQAFNLNPLMRDRFVREVQQLDQDAMAAYRADALVGRSGSQSAGLLQVGIMLVSGYFVIQGSLTVGTMVAFSAMVQNLVAAISHLSGAAPHVVKATSSLKRVDELFDYGDERPDETRFAVMPRPKQALHVTDLSFAYPNARPSLHDVGFTAVMGTRVALVGPSGCGKSTLLKLLMGFEDPLRGSIALDDYGSANYSKTAWREHLSLVPQEPFVFNMSVRENIRLGRLEADDAAVEAAARAAGIHTVIAALPEGYETLVGDGGSQLSGGQKQRIALARAVLRQPAVLVLDEGTSALDPATERRVMAELEAAVADSLLVTVTHRLQTVVPYEQILVMRDGAVVESGRHEQLLTAEGLYRELWDKQQGFTISDDGRSAEITVRRLMQVDLFQGIESDAVARLCDLFESHFFSEKQLVFAKGDPGVSFYIIADGAVEVQPYAVDETRFKRLLLETGDFFGELALLDDRPRSATVKTRIPTLLLALSRQNFEVMLDVAPRLKERIERTARGRRDAS